MSDLDRSEEKDLPLSHGEEEVTREEAFEIEDQDAYEDAIEWRFKQAEIAAEEAFNEREDPERFTTYSLFG